MKDLKGAHVIRREGMTGSRRDFIAGTIALAGSAWLPAFAAKKPNLRIGLLSDVHIAELSGRSPEAYRRALVKFRDAHVDGVCITGDLAIWGQIREFECGAKIWFDVFPDDKLPDGSPVARLFCTGNHDDDGWAYSGAYKNYATVSVDEARKTSFFFHRQETWKRLYHEDWVPIFYKDVKGYRFIMRNWPCRVQGLGICAGKIKNEHFDVKGFLASHREELSGDRPFFYLQHEPLRGTCNASDETRRDEIAEAFDAFPNGIVLSGHTHYSTVEDRSIWQGAFTAVNCGSTCGWAFTQSGRENGHGETNGTEEMPLLADAFNCRQAMLMDVYDDRIEFRRFEVMSDRPTGPDWVVPLGAGAPKPYRFDVRAAASHPPVFPADAKVEVRFIADGCDRKKARHPQVEVRFPSVNGLSTAGDRAFDYRIDLIVCNAEGERTRASRRVFSPCVLRPAEEDVASVSCLFAASDLPPDGRIRFAVIPFSEWGKAGRTICSQSYTKKEIEIR